ncbi:MAG: phospholipase D family protein [Deltaproteobacteria bacterium]
MSVYFSPSSRAPDGSPTEAIVREIKGAKQEILIQAYSFTSTPIAKALVEAKGRGIKVEAILDKTNDSRSASGGTYSGAKFLLNAGIPAWIDYQPAIAHSKVMIIDQAVVITGSFNFTRAAEEKNAENLLVLRNDPALVAKYLKNYQDRKSVSRIMQ